MVNLKDIAEYLIQGEEAKVRELVQAALGERKSPKEILDQGLVAGMNVVGQRFKNNEIFIPEVLLSARAMQAGMQVLEPALVRTGAKPIAKVVLGTVKGDIHNIGKNLVGMMLQGVGFKVIDLGIDVPPERFVEVVGREKAQLLGMSGLLTTTIPFMRTTIEALEQAELKGQVKVMVGGAVVTRKFAEEIGADGYAPDAASAVDKARDLLGLG